MTRLTTKGFVEALGVFGVIGSLIFVGLEVRQTSVATRAATNATVAGAGLELNLAIASSPDLARAMVAVGEEPEAASPSDRISVLGLWRAQFHQWSNIHRQWLNETLDRVLYESMVEDVSTYSMKANTDLPADQLERRQRTMQWAWESEKRVFNREFRDFVDTIIETGFPPN
jgi:hypothetical protein